MLIKIGIIIHPKRTKICKLILSIDGFFLNVPQIKKREIWKKEESKYESISYWLFKLLKYEKQIINILLNTNGTKNHLR